MNELLTTQYELIHTRLFKSGQRTVVSLTLDKKGGRISLDECADWNRKLSDKIDENNLIAGAYLMEVSSPGLDRALKTERDFERAAGEALNIHYRNHDGAVIQGKYVLQNALGGILTLQDENNRSEIQLELSQIVSAKRALEFKKADR